MGERNNDDGAITRGVHLDEFAFLNERGMREKIVNISDYMKRMSRDRTFASSVEVIIFIMVGVRAVKMISQAELHQDHEQRNDQRQVSVGLRNHGYLRMRTDYLHYATKLGSHNRLVQIAIVTADKLC